MSLPFSDTKEYVQCLNTECTRMWLLTQMCHSFESLLEQCTCWGTEDAEIGLLTRMAHLLVSNWCYAGERQQLCRKWSLHCQTPPCLAPSQRCVQLRPASHCHGDVREHVCCSGRQAPLLKRQCLWPAQDYYFCQLAVPVVKIFYFLMKCCSIDYLLCTVPTAV